MPDAPFDAILAMIARAERMILFGHVAPDGDALGSALGLAWLLRAQGKVADLSFADPPPDNVAFLPGLAEVADRSAEGYDLVIALDGSDGERYGEHFNRARESGVPILCIDHHKTNTHFATLNWVDSRYAATAHMVADLARHAGWPMSREAAICLLTGCVTDTNAFSTDHTSPELLEQAAALMRAGAPLAPIIRRAMQQRSATDALLWGRILATLTIEPGLAWASSTRADREAVGASAEDGNGIATFIRNIIGVKVGLLFVEEEGKRVRLSMRSALGYDVGALAFELGGGGHAQASGATIEGTLDEVMARVLPAARALVAEGGSDER